MAALAEVSGAQKGAVESSLRHKGDVPDTEAERDQCLILPDEEGPLAELKLKVQDVLRDLPQHSDLVGDLRLLRFLRGHGNADAAADAFREAMSFRKEAGIENIRKKYFPDESKVDFLISSIELPHANLVQGLAGVGIILGRCDDGDLCMVGFFRFKNISVPLTICTLGLGEMKSASFRLISLEVRVVTYKIPQ